MSGWLRSRKAFTLFRYAAWIVVCMGMFMAFMPTPWFSQIVAMHRGELLLRILGALLGILGGPASLVILFGMAIYCIREDDSSTGSKVLWFAVFFITAPFGATAYFFSVYQQQMRAQGYAPVGVR